MKTVLLVDDSPTIRRMAMSALRSLPDLRFIEAGNGLAALESLALESVDIMTLDLNMPDMHGLEVLRFLRAHPIYSAIPVIVLTTRADEESHTLALAAGASTYMTKPFNPITLAGEVQRLMQR